MMEPERLTEEQKQVNRDGIRKAREAIREAHVEAHAEADESNPEREGGRLW